MRFIRRPSGAEVESADSFVDILTFGGGSVTTLVNDETGGFDEQNVFVGLEKANCMIRKLIVVGPFVYAVLLGVRFRESIADRLWRVRANFYAAQYGMSRLQHDVSGMT